MIELAQAPNREFSVTGPGNLLGHWSLRHALETVAGLTVLENRQQSLASLRLGCRSIDIRSVTMSLRIALANSVPKAVMEEVQRWYSAPDVRHWMHTEFQVAGLVTRMSYSGLYFGGRYRLASWGWVGFDKEDRPVSFMGGDVIVNRFEHHDRPLNSVEAGPRTLGFTYATGPEHQGNGHGRNLVRAVLEHPTLAEVDVLSCSIDRKNERSLRLIRGIPGFEETGGDEGSLHFKYDRSALAKPTAW